jgi:hypothetical protein
LLDHRRVGVFSHPSFKLAHRNQPLAPAPDQAELRRYVGVEEVRANSELGHQPFGRERGAIHLNEALIDRDLPILGPDVGEDRIGDQRAASAAAATVEGMGDLMPPGKRQEFVAPLPRRP